MAEVPLSLVAPVRLSVDTPNGFLLPHKKSDPPLLAINSEKQPHVLRLGGDDQYAFHFYPIKTGYSATGTLISDIEIVVDLDSRYDPVRETNPLGALVLQDGTISVMAIIAGDVFGDPTQVELWGGLQSGTSEEKVGFARWTIVARDGEKRVTLWSNDKEGAVTATKR